MLFKLVQSIQQDRNLSSLLPRKRFQLELHIFFKKFQMACLRTVTCVLVSHMLPQLQLFRTQEKNTKVTDIKKKAGTTKILAELTKY